MIEPCELYRQIPKEQIARVFQTSETAGSELDPEFLGFEKIYKAVTLFVPQDRVIIDCGCGYAFQAWYFRKYRRYIGVDRLSTENDVFRTDNSEFYHMSIQDFIRKEFPKTGYATDEVFAICSHVPDREAQKLVREAFPHCLAYYPT